MALSKNKIKYIRSLELKKIRKEAHVFMAEGSKLVGDLLGVFPCLFICATEEWINNHPNVEAEEIVEVTNDELSRVSLLKTPQQVLAIFKQPEYHMDASVVRNSLCIALDDIQDPGNLGTIVRLADWFGIEHIFCSSNTADIYNPKTVQATMGAVARVKVHYVNLPQFIASLKDCFIYGTFLDGKNIYSESLTSSGLIVMGNEGKGISKEIEGYINRKLYIPNYPADRETSESLNVAIATAVTCAEFRRQVTSSNP